MHTIVIVSNCSFKVRTVPREATSDGHPMLNLIVSIPLAYKYTLFRLTQPLKKQ